jgi:hypothetical protein
MLAAWTNFAKAASPNPPSLQSGREKNHTTATAPNNEEEEELSWPLFTAESRQCLVLQPEPEVRADPYPERMLLWRRLVWDPLINTVEMERLRAERVMVTAPAATTPLPSTWVAPAPPYYVPLWYPWRTQFQTWPILPTAG